MCIHPLFCVFYFEGYSIIHIKNEIKAIRNISWIVGGKELGEKKNDKRIGFLFFGKFIYYSRSL